MGNVRRGKGAVVEPAGRFRGLAAIEAGYQHFRLERQGALLAPNTLLWYDRMVLPFQLGAGLGVMAASVDRPTRAGLYGLLIGTGLATVAAMGPLVSAITITVGVETRVGDAAGLPDARMLPAALEGVGAVALIFR
jgi:hypothetical protein